jgi:hypothetical protein
MLLISYKICHVPVAHAYDPSYSRGWWFKVSLGKSFERPYLKKTHHKNNGWWGGSR